MTVVTTIAQRILDENNYTVSDISLTNTEYLIKNAVDYINAETGTSITFTPSAGTASLSASDTEIVTVKFITRQEIQDYKSKGPNATLSGMSVVSILDSPLVAKMVDRMLNRLRVRSFDTT